jgi:hypothetical protein
MQIEGSCQVAADLFPRVAQWGLVIKHEERRSMMKLVRNRKKQYRTVLKTDCPTAGKIVSKKSYSVRIHFLIVHDRKSVLNDWSCTTLWARSGRRSTSTQWILLICMRLEYHFPRVFGHSFGHRLWSEILCIPSSHRCVPSSSCRVLR